MTVPCDPENTPEPHEEEQEIVLRLSDILPRVPVHCLKPGPHDKLLQIRFSVEELAEKISRGRVSVPLERLASACPDVFTDSSALPGEQEIPLPLQKLLEQVGLVAAKPPVSYGIPGEQLAQAREQAARIIAENQPELAVNPGAASADPGGGIAKAVSAAFQLLGLFGKKQSKTQVAVPQKDKDLIPNPEEKISTGDHPSESPPPVQQAPPAPAQASPPVPTPQPVPPGCISVRALPVFRLLPAAILRSEALPPEETRVSLPPRGDRSSTAWRPCRDSAGRFSQSASRRVAACHLPRA